MDLKLKDAVFHSTLPHVPTLVMLALSNCIYHTGDICNPSIATLVRITRLSRITVLRTLSELKRRGIVSVSKRARGRKGEANVYVIAAEKLSTGTEGVGISQKPNPAKVGISQKPIKNLVENTEGERSARERAAASGDAAHTHTNSNSDDMFVLGDGVSISATDIARKSRLALQFVKDTLAELEARGWATTKGIRITRKNIQAQLRAWWSNPLTDQTRYIRPQGNGEEPKVYKPRDWQQCREDCAKCTAAGCGAGVKIPPMINPTRQYPPAECTYFVASEDFKQRARERKRGTAK